MAATYDLSKLDRPERLVKRFLTGYVSPMSRKKGEALKPNVYLRLDEATLRRVRRHMAEMQRVEDVLQVRQSDALRDLVRRGLDEADVDRGRRARRRR